MPASVRGRAGRSLRALAAVSLAAWLGGFGNDTLVADGRSSGRDSVAGGPGRDVCAVDSRRVDSRWDCETIRSTRSLR